MAIAAALTAPPGERLDAALVMTAAMAVTVAVIVAIDARRNRELASFDRWAHVQSPRLELWLARIDAGKQIRVGGRSLGQRVIAVLLAGLFFLAGVRALPEADAFIGFGVALLMLPLAAALDRSTVDRVGIKTIRRSARWDDVIAVEPRRYEHRTIISLRWVKLTTRDGTMAVPASRSSHVDVTELCQSLQRRR